MKADVAVIGGGPAGSTAAAFLARAGAEVVIVNREPFPRDKLCGEFLSYDALPILEEIAGLDAIDAAGATRIRRCRVIGDASTYDIEFPHEARGISRLTLDSSLFRIARDAGANTIDGWSADRVERDRDVFRILGTNGTIETRVVIGAWGRWGRIDQQLDRPFIHDRSHRYFGFKRHYSGPPLDGSIDLYSFRHGYLGVSPIEGGATNICGLVHHERIVTMRAGWSEFVESLGTERTSLANLFASHTPLQDEFLSSDPVIFSAKSPVERGMLMIGDAAGQLDPLTGNGMSMGIQSGLLAAIFARRILRGEERETLLMRYARAHADLFAMRIWWSRRIAALLCRPHLLDAAIRFVPFRAPGAFGLRRTRATRDDVARLLESWRALR